MVRQIAKLKASNPRGDVITRRRRLADAGGLAVLGDDRSCGRSAAAADRPQQDEGRQEWRSSDAVRSRPARDRWNISRARCPWTRCSRRSNRRVRVAPASHSSRVLAPPGTRILIVTSGSGWVQHEGGPVEDIRPGDVVWFAPGEKHWHGATPTTAMTHIAIQEMLNGNVVEWMEKVSDEQYRK